jgi:hypothetical protein
MARKKYWKIHQENFESGNIEKGRGRGGTVILVNELNPVAAGSVAAEPSPTKMAGLDGVAARESDLYQPSLDQLQKHWAVRRQLDQCHCEITAMQGRRETGGSWTRPDITVAGHKKYEYLPQEVLEIFTFEVKPEWDVSIKGVMEALAHREAATRSYVIYSTGKHSFDEFPEASRIEEIAARHGVGVLVAHDIADFDTWEEVTGAVRGNPDPDALETFIKRTLSEEGKSKLRKWF